MPTEFERRLGHERLRRDVDRRNEHGQTKTILSGPPTTCTSSITFAVSADRGDLKVGNSYVAIVDGYTATNLSAVKRDQRAVESSGNPTAPSWQWLCSFGALPEDTLSTLLDVLQTIPRQPTHVPNADASTAPDAGVSSNSDDAAALDASSDAATELSDGHTEAGLVDASPSTSAVDASPPDASPVDAATDASTQSGADAASSGASTVETTGDLVPLDSGLLGLNLRDGASSVDAGVATQPADPTTVSDAASTDEVAASALEFLLEIAKDPTTPGPATLVQSRLGTLRGCVALP